MSYFYMVVFLVGVFYTFVSLIISGISGGFHSHGDIGANVDGHIGNHGNLDVSNVDTGHSGELNVGHAADGSQLGNIDGQHGHASGDNQGFSHSLVSWFAIIINPIVAVSFLTVFGGMGIMGENYFKWNGIVIFIVALASGIIVATILYNFVAKPIYRSENTSDVSREELIGTLAEVTTDIIESGYGTIKYTVNSIMYTAPARHIEGAEVKHGEKVFICKIEDNTFYISQISTII